MPPTIGVNLRVTGNCNRGGRGHMEDMFSVAYQPTGDSLDLEYAYFGIFDGHGGSEAAYYAKENLLKNIVNQKLFWSSRESDICAAIENGFLRTHYGMWKDLEKWPKTITGLPSTSGTTASIVFIRRATIYVGHIGDSGIVLGQKLDDAKWVPKRLTEDHKPENPKEVIRITKAGGQVINKGGVPRVVWRRIPASHQGPTTRSTQYERVPFLAVARSLGDLWSYNEETDQFVVSPIPDIEVRRIDLNHDKCIILGTDGLFNMISPAEAVEVVEKVERHNKTLKDHPEHRWINPSKVLVDHAISKWNRARIRADNTSAVVLLLDPLGPPRDIESQETGSTHAYTIESYKTREDSDKIEPGGMAICTLTEKPDKLAYRAKTCTTLKGMAALFEGGYESSMSRSRRVDSLMQAGSSRQGHTEGKVEIPHGGFSSRNAEKHKSHASTIDDHGPSTAKRHCNSKSDEPIASSSKECNPPATEPLIEEEVEEVLDDDILVEEVLVEEVLVDDHTLEDLLIEEVEIEDFSIEGVQFEDVQTEDVQGDVVQVDDTQIDNYQVDDYQVDDRQDEDHQVEHVQVDHFQVEDAQVEDFQVEDIHVEVVQFEDIQDEEGVPVEDIYIEDVLVEDLSIEDPPIGDSQVEDLTNEDPPIEDLQIEDAPVEDLSGENPPDLEPLVIESPLVGEPAGISDQSDQEDSLVADQPVISDIPKPPHESDAENSDVPMRLRSSARFRTLRSRNVNTGKEEDPSAVKSKGHQRQSPTKSNVKG